MNGPTIDECLDHSGTSAIEQLESHLQSYLNRHVRDRHLRFTATCADNGSPLWRFPSSNPRERIIMQKLVQGIHHFQDNLFSPQRELFERLTQGQHPDALFITSSDSRINPNRITQTKQASRKACGIPAWPVAVLGSHQRGFSRDSSSNHPRSRQALLV